MTPTNTPRDVTLPDAFSDVLNGIGNASQITQDLHTSFWMMGRDKDTALFLLKSAHKNFCELATAMGYRVTPLDARENYTPQAYADLARVIGGKDTREDGE